MGNLDTSLSSGISRELPRVTRPTRVRYVVLAAGCSMALLSYVLRIAFALYANEIRLEFGLNKADVGDLMFAFLFAYSVLQIPAGLAGDRLGARLLLTLFMLGSALATAAIVLVPHPVESENPRAGVLFPLVMLIILRAIFGAMQSGVFPVFTRVVADWVPLTERGGAQGAMWTASRLGGALVPPVLTWMFVKLNGWRAPMEIVAVLGLLWSVGFWFWFRNRPEDNASVNDEERALIGAGRTVVTGVRQPVPWKKMLGSRSVWCLCLMYGCCGPAGNFMLTLLPLYLSDQRSLDRDTGAWVVGLPLAAGFIACLCGGLVSDRLIRLWGSRKWGRRANGLVGLVLAGLAFAGTVYVQDVWLLGLLLCVAQFGNDFNMAPAWAACADVGERYAGTISGAMNMISCMTGAVAAKVAGHYFERGEPAAVFLAFGGIWLLGALCWFGIDVNKSIARSA
jgi:sugar phosphate permease